MLTAGAKPPHWQLQPPPPQSRQNLATGGLARTEPGANKSFVSPNAKKYSKVNSKFIQFKYFRDFKSQNFAPAVQQVVAFFSLFQPEELPSPSFLWILKQCLTTWSCVICSLNLLSSFRLELPSSLHPNLEQHISFCHILESMGSLRRSLNPRPGRGGAKSAPPPVFRR